jgi:hypothetical protein
MPRCRFGDDGGDYGRGRAMLTKAIAQTEKFLNQLDRRAVLQRQEDAAALVKRWELADPRDRWKHTGEKRPIVEDIALEFKPRPYTTAQSTIDAFWCVVGLDDPDRLKAWFANHPRDVPALLKLLETKRC